MLIMPHHLCTLPLLLAQGWRSYSSGPATLTCVDGDHMFTLQRDAKQMWLAAVAAALQANLPMTPLQ
jgi:surfactin synthase thioesterase subunit